VEATESNSAPWQQRNAQEKSKTSTEALKQPALDLSRFDAAC